MVVEDTVLVSLELQEMLKKEGYRIAAAAISGEEAIEIFRESEPDIVLMDIMLEGEMSGIEAALIIQTIREVPIIYTTAYSDEDTVSEIHPTEPYAFIKKPYDYRELVIAIEIALKRHYYEKRIIASENKYRKLFDNSRDALFLINDEGILLEFNQSLLRLTGHSGNDLHKLNMAEILNSSSELNEIIAKINTDGYIEDYETELISKNGNRLNCQITSTRISNENDQQHVYQGIIKDVTELKRSMLRQREMMLGIIKAMASTVEARDPYTAGHQMRVADISVLIANEIGLSAERVREISMAAMIHDLGKISVPAEILSKPGRITEVEFSLIKSHSTIGYDILKVIDFPFPLADIVHQHHERIDGSGYPLGLHNEDILLEAKIIAVADVVEAMASHRPYRPALGIDVAIKEVVSKRGIHYDENVVDAFYAIAENHLLDGIVVA